MTDESTPKVKMNTIKWLEGYYKKAGKPMPSSYYNEISEKNVIESIKDDNEQKERKKKFKKSKAKRKTKKKDCGCK